MTMLIKLTSRVFLQEEPTKNRPETASVGAAFKALETARGTLGQKQHKPQFYYAKNIDDSDILCLSDLGSGKNIESVRF